MNRDYRDNYNKFKNIYIVYKDLSQIFYSHKNNSLIMYEAKKKDFYITMNIYFIYLNNTKEIYYYQLNEIILNFFVKNICIKYYKEKTVAYSNFKRGINVLKKINTMCNYKNVIYII
jgi:hypothetical protein